MKDTSKSSHFVAMEQEYLTPDIQDEIAMGGDIDLDEIEESAQLYEHFRVVADKGQQLVRIDKFLLDHLPDTSRNRLQAAAKAGYLHVNDIPVKSNYRVKPGDVITVSEKAKQMPLVVLALESAERNFADYVSVDSANFTATFVRVPAFEDVPYPVQMFPELVVEFYSR